MADFPRTQELNALEDELRRDAIIEIGIRGNDLISKVTQPSAVKASIYDDPEKMQEMIDELDGIVQSYVRTAGRRGRLLGTKALDRFLDESERMDRTQKMLRIVRQSNERHAARRLNLYSSELGREAQILKSDILLFKKRARIAGFSEKETLAQLVRAGQDKAGPVAGFEKRMKSVTVAATRREKAAAKIEAFREGVRPNVKWQWITVSAKPCPDCQARAGVILTLEEWRAKGLPGAGRTICQQFCMCNLYPLSVAEEQFPVVKQFKWDKESLVLTTDGEARTFGAKSHQPKE